MYYAIKIQKAGDKIWRFVRPNGSTTRLRVHAACYETRERADEVMAHDKVNNPGIEFKVVPLFGGKGG